MTNKPLNDDGGPAFPSPENDYAVMEYGMSVRDYFAGQALPAVIAEWRDAQPLMHETWNQVVARNAYALTDAMIKFREDNQ